jgi:hypothetical protein
MVRGVFQVFFVCERQMGKAVQQSVLVVTKCFTAVHPFDDVFGIDVKGGAFPRSLRLLPVELLVPSANV